VAAGPGFSSIGPTVEARAEWLKGETIPHKYCTLTMSRKARNYFESGLLTSSQFLRPDIVSIFTNAMIFWRKKMWLSNLG
jgi:hypothetical protein